MTLPKHYYSGLSKKNTSKQLNELKKSQKLYTKGIFHIRPKMESFISQSSRHVIEFEKKYCVKITHLKSVEKVTGVPISALKKIINKGMGAYYSSGSRPNQTPHSWAYARLASTLLKHNAYKIDKHVLDEAKVDIKPPPSKKCSKKNRIATGGSKIIDCCKINDKNESKYNKCIRKSDNKVFKLPRRFNRSKCKNQKGFTMRSSCSIYKNC